VASIVRRDNRLIWNIYLRNLCSDFTGADFVDNWILNNNDVVSVLVQNARRVTQQASDITVSPMRHTLSERLHMYNSCPRVITLLNVAWESFS
jgi:hypothetical protein